MHKLLVSPYSSVPMIREEAEQQEELIQKIKEKIFQEGDILQFPLDSPEELRLVLQSWLSRYFTKKKMILSQEEEEQIRNQLIDEMVGYGPLEPLLADEEITEIIVNGPNEIFIEKNGRLIKSDLSFRNEQILRHVIDRIVSPLGRRIDLQSPMVDARLPDGSRVNAVIAPISLNGSLLSIRKFRRTPFSLRDLVEIGTLSEEMAEYLRNMMRNRKNVVISGGTGSGKTTLLNALAHWIPRHERLITIEDSAELQLSHPHVVRLEVRPPNLEGKGEVTIRQLVRNALRMRPDRIIIGEVRGAEAFDMLQAMNTGHEGSLTTVHANSPLDAMYRLEGMVLMAKLEFSSLMIQRFLASTIHCVIQIARFPDGQRRILSIAEVEFENDRFVMREQFCYDPSGDFVQKGDAGC